MGERPWRIEFMQMLEGTDPVTCSYRLDLSNTVVREKARNRRSYVQRVVK